MGTRTLSQFCKALKKYDHFLLSCHILPEGDAIGSMLAMESLLRKLGKKTTVVCADEFPTRLSILSSRKWKRVNQVKEAASSFQALVTTDCPTLQRIGAVQDLITPDTVIFNIDHHISNDYFGNYNYVRPNASACGEVVYEIFKKMKVPISKEDAKNIYVAITTDTGSFKYANTTVNCHRVASDLIGVGIDIDKINDSIYSTYSLNKIQLYSRLLSRVRTIAKGQIAWVEMRRSDLKQSGATDEDAEGFIDFLKYIKEVKVAFFMIEMPGNRHIRVSFRSKGNIDVNEIATYFHGGGHKKASGCSIHGSLAQAEKMILSRIKKALKMR